MKSLKRTVRAKMMKQRLWLGRKGPTTKLNLQHLKVVNHLKVLRRMPNEWANQWIRKWWTTCTRWTLSWVISLKAFASPLKTSKKSRRSPIETISSEGRDLQTESQQSWTTSWRTTLSKYLVRALLRNRKQWKVEEPRPSVTQRIPRKSETSIYRNLLKQNNFPD